jgi:hypothetical protein
MAKFLARQFLVYVTGLPLGAGITLGIMALAAHAGGGISDPQGPAVIGAFFGGAFSGYAWGKYWGGFDQRRLGKMYKDLDIPHYK